MNGNLEFTGNWFVDLGILGFVNLMEEVYGWDLDRIKELIDRDYGKCVYVYFPLGYLFYHSKIRGFYKEDKALRDKISNEISKIRKDEKEKEDLENEYKKEENKKNKERIQIKLKNLSNKINEKIKKVEELHKKLQELRENLQKSKNCFADLVSKIPDDSKINDNILNQLIPDFKLYPPEDHRNFFLFNPKKNLPVSFKYLNFLLKEKYTELKAFVSEQSKKKAKEGLTYEVYPDSTINPFLFSPQEFANVTYAKLFSVHKIRESIKFNFPIYLPLLCFSHAFQHIGIERITFYTNNLNITYGLNKKFKLLIKRKGDNQSLLSIMWKAIIDQLIETKAKLNLENIYFVRFEKIKRLKLVGVEFIDISKLQAEILIDDKIRDALNTSIKVLGKREDKGSEKSDVENTRWVLEEFIKKKPLLPLFYRTLRLYFSGKINNFPSKAMIYSAAVDKVISELNSDKCKPLFSDEFFNKHKTLVEEIRENLRIYFKLKRIITQVFESLENERETLAHKLFSRLRKNHKFGFVNEVLRALNTLEDKKNVDFVISHLFNNILQNEISWQSDAVPIIAGLLKEGGKEDED